MKVLFVDIDTLRPDHMGCYGYNRNTTPNMDVVAKDGIMFRNYFCSDAPCLPSRAALVSGQFGIHNGAVGHGGTAADMFLAGMDRKFRCIRDDGNLFGVFRKAGMYAASISTFPERHSAWWFNSNFNEMHNVGKGGQESGEEVLPIALEWLDKNKDRDDWFLHVHFWDPHTPYRAPEGFGNPFENEELDTWITEDVFAKHLEHIGPHGPYEINMFDDRERPEYPRQPGKILDKTGLKKMMDGYDCGVKYADVLVGQIIDKLREQNIYDDVAIIITSDHGEDMGELGIYGEHGVADEATCHIPMIVKWPGGVTNHVAEGFHYNIDLAPTVATLLNGHVQPHWDGSSYAETITEGKDMGRDYLVLSQMAHVCQRSARFGDWLYIRTYHDGYHLFDKEMLFNITNDPHQQFDVKDEHPELCAKGAAIIFDWHDDMMMTSTQTTDPLWLILKEGGPFHAKNRLPHYLDHLEATGRKAGADRLRAKYHVE